MRQFMILWVGQLASIFGTNLSGFALGIWVYQRTGSATDYAVIHFLTMLPSILLAPLAGPLIDRMNRRTVILLSDLGAAILTAVMLAMAMSDNLSIWIIYLATAVSSGLGAFQGPALLAGITQMVPREKLGRANGMMQIVHSIGPLGGPLVAGLLLARFEIWVVLAIDLVTFCIAAISLLMIRIPDVEVKERTEDKKPGLWSEMREAIEFTKARKGLIFLLVAFAFVNGQMGSVMVLVTPMLLTMTDVQTLGIMSTAIGLGMLVGSVFSTRDFGNRMVNVIFMCQFFAGLCIVAVGLTENLWLIGAFGFAFYASLPVVVACSNTIWALEVPEELQGRVFSLRRMIAWSTMPIAYLVSGPLADHVFEPMMAEGGRLAASMGEIVGVGPGRGIALMFIILGTGSMLSTLITRYSPAWQLGRNVKKEEVAVA